MYKLIFNFSWFSTFQWNITILLKKDKHWQQLLDSCNRCGISLWHCLKILWSKIYTTPYRRHIVTILKCWLLQILQNVFKSWRTLKRMDPLESHNSKCNNQGENSQLIPALHQCFAVESDFGQLSLHWWWWRKLRWSCKNINIRRQHRYNERKQNQWFTNVGRQLAKTDLWIQEQRQHSAGLGSTEVLRSKMPRHSCAICHEAIDPSLSQYLMLTENMIKWDWLLCYFPNS